MSHRLSLRPHWPFAVLLVVILPLLLFRLPEVPHIWYDEGLNLTAARTLAETGLYALPSADELRIADPAIQTGPPLIIPLAVLHHLFGPNLGVARLAVVIISLAALVALYALAYRLYGPLAAYLSAAVVLILPGDTTANYMMMSRQVLGELPAILAIALGLHLLLDDNERWWKNALAGLLFGVAATTKSQVLLVLTAALGLTALIEVLRSRREWRRWALILGLMAVFYGLDTLWRGQMAGASWSDNLATLRQGALIHIIPFRLLANLVVPGVAARLVIVLAAVAAALALQRRQPASAPQTSSARRTQLFLMVLVTVWLLWYALVSIGWQRYSFVGMVFAALVGGYVVARLLARFTPDRRMYAVLTGVVVVTIGVQQVPRLLNDTTGRDFFDLMDYVQATLTPDDRVITWEWPARYITDTAYYYPQTAVVNIITEDLFLKQAHYDVTNFNALAACPNYLLLGSFNVDRYVLAEAHEAAEAQPVFDQGVYQLYRISEHRLDRRADGTCTLNRSSLQAK